MIMNDDAEQRQRSHAGDDGQEGLDLGRLPPNPCGHGVDRSSWRPHGGGPFVFCFCPCLAGEKVREKQKKGEDGESVGRPGKKNEILIWMCDECERLKALSLCRQSFQNQCGNRKIGGGLGGIETTSFNCSVDFSHFNDVVW